MLRIMIQLKHTLSASDPPKNFIKRMTVQKVLNKNLKIQKNIMAKIVKQT